MTAPVGTAAPVTIDLGVVGRLPMDDLLDSDPAGTYWTLQAPHRPPRPAPFGAVLLVLVGCLALGGATPARQGPTELYSVQMASAWYTLDDESFYLVTGWGEVTAFSLADGVPRWRADTGRPVAAVELPDTGPVGPLAVHWQGFCRGLTRLDPGGGVPLWTRSGVALGGTGPVLAILRSADVGCDITDVQSPYLVGGTDVLDVVDVVDGWTGEVRRSISIGYRARWALGPANATIATWDPHGQLVEHDLVTGAVLTTGVLPALADPPGEGLRLPPSLSAVGDLWVALTPASAGSVPGTTITAYDRATLSPRWTVRAPEARTDGRVRYDAHPCGAAICVVLGGATNLVLDPGSGAELGRFVDGARPLGPGPFGVLSVELDNGGRRDVIVDRRSGAPVRPDFELRGFVVGTATGRAGDGATALLSRARRGGVELATFDPAAGRWREVGAVPGQYGQCGASRRYLLCVDSRLTLHVFRRT